MKFASILAIGAMLATVSNVSAIELARKKKKEEPLPTA
jgi:hypothetical protein